MTRDMPGVYVNDTRYKIECVNVCRKLPAGRNRGSRISVKLARQCGDHDGAVCDTLGIKYDLILI